MRAQAGLLIGTPAPACGTAPPVATSARRGTAPRSSGNGLAAASELDPEAYRHTGPPPTCRRPDVGVATTAPLPLGPGGPFTRIALGRRCGRRWLPAELGAGGLGQVAERLALPEEDHRPVLQVQGGGGMVGVDRELQRPARLVGQAHLRVGIAVLQRLDQRLDG